jgi:hypothetical protein
MANPNPEIWGAPSSWIYSLRQSGLETTEAKLGNFDKPKTAYFGTGPTSGAEGSLVRAINVSHKLTANEFLDESICPCGQDSTVSPWGKIAIFNKNHDGSTVPEIQDFTDKNVNWFFADKPTSVPLFQRQIIRQHDNFIHNEQYAPNATTPINGNNNIPVNLCPYVSWGLKSLLLSIEVGVTANNDNPISGNMSWVTLDSWRDNYATTHYMTGLRFFVRGCTAVNNTTLALTYNNDGALPSGNGSSGLICILNKIKVKNPTADTPTQFLHFMGYEGTTRRAHIFTPTGQIVNDSSNTNTPTLGVLPCWNYFQNQTIEVYHPYSDTYYYYYKIPYSDDTYNKIMAIAALFGCFFTPTNKYVFEYDMLDNDLYLPILDDNGVGHGQYTRGAENANNSLYTKNSIRDIDYDPDAPPTPVDPNTYSNITGFNSISAGASATERYVLDAGNTRQLLSDLWTISHNIAGADYENYDYKILDSFLVTNPIDCIISLKRFPFSIPHTFSSAKTPVNLGKNHGSAEGYLTYNVFNTVQFAGINIFPRFGNSFLDYAPYTEYELYVPFCGTVKLNAGDILGHTLNCRLQIDLITGACTAYIMADSLVIETMTGTVSCELALTGIDSATIDANIQNSVLNHVNARTNKETSMLSPLSIGGLGSAALNPFKTAGNITTAKTELQRAEYELTHIQAQPHTMGTAGGLTGWYQEFNARLMIYYPEGDVITSAQPPELKNLTSYGHTTGFATIDNAALSNYSGFTVATNAILNFAATTTEKDMIESALNGGIFI